jgi:hypothetical protein
VGTREWEGEVVPVTFTRPDPIAAARAVLAEELPSKIRRLVREWEWRQKNSSLPPK